MKFGKLIKILSVNALMLSPIVAAPYEELVPHFDRMKSSVSVRKIAHPTLANLDFAAYDRNPVLADFPQSKPAKTAPVSVTSDFLFGGIVKKLTNDIDSTPLTKSEIENPVAWKPYVKRLWQVVKDNSLSDAGAKIAGVKWGAHEVYLPFQEVAAAYLHEENGVTTIWVKIEFAPWAEVSKYPADNDGDGVREIYGELSLEKMHPDSLRKTIEWTANEYRKVVLDRQQTIDWVTELASYWYPTRNTDIVTLGKDGVWPDETIPKKIRKQVGTLTVKEPVAVIEGKPVSPDKPIYNVFVVDFGVVKASIPAEHGAPVKEKADTERQVNGAYADTRSSTAGVLSLEVKKNGTFATQMELLSPVHRGLQHIIDSLPKEQMAFAGNDGWLFFRKSLEYLLGGDLELQNEEKNPVKHITALDRYLQMKKIKLLVVPVPCKEEIYPEYIGNGISVKPGTILNPYGRKVILALLQNGIDVVDLLPLFLEEKKRDNEKGPLYQKQDTHWNGRGIKIAAREIAERVRAHFGNMPGSGAVTYLTHDTLVTRIGDLVERLPAIEQQRYSPDSIKVQQVRQADGIVYKSNLPDAPVLLMGDSYTGVFELIDGKGAGAGAHIAAESGLPVDIITSWGGGPLVRQKMIRMRSLALDKKKVVIYMMTMRDLYNYAQGWDDLIVE